METMRTTGMDWIAGFAVVVVACRAPESTDMRTDVAPVRAVPERNAAELATGPQRSAPKLLRSAERPGGPAVEVWSIPDGREWRVVATFVPLEPDGTERVHELGRQRPGFDVLPGTHVMDIQMSPGLSLIRTSEALSSDDAERERWFVFDSAGELLSKTARPLGPAGTELVDAQLLEVETLDLAPLLFVIWVGRTSDGQFGMLAELRDGLEWSSTPVEVFRRPFSRPGASVSSEPIRRFLNLARSGDGECVVSHCMSDLKWTIKLMKDGDGSEPTSWRLECSSAAKWQ